MKKLLLLLFILVCFTAFAEDKKNTDYMKQLSDIKSLSAEFKQINNLKDYGEDIYTGKVYINMKEKALWDYTEPYSSWYLITNTDINHYDEINNQLIKMKTKDYKEYALLQVLMDFSQLSKSFSAEQKDNTLYLKPKNDTGLAYINIVFKNDVISEINSKDNAGNLTTITLSKVEIDKKISDSSFKKKYLNIKLNIGTFEVIKKGFERTFNLYGACY